MQNTTKKVGQYSSCLEAKGMRKALQRPGSGWNMRRVLGLSLLAWSTGFTEKVFLPSKSSKSTNNQCYWQLMQLPDYLPIEKLLLLL